MQNLRRNSSLQLTIAMIGVGILLSLAVGYWIGKNGLGYRPLLLGILIIVGLLLVLLGQRGVEIGLVMWVWMFAVGYRTITITSLLKLHPLTLFILALLVLQWIQLAFVARKPVAFQMPKVIWLFALFWVWGWAVGIGRGNYWDAMAAEFLNFVIIIPLFLLISVVMQNPANWNRMALSMVGVSTFISFLGILEYFFPSAGHLLPGFVGTDTYFVAEGGFIRATFASWGSPAATFVVALALPFVLPVWQQWQKPFWRVILVGIIVIQFVAIYIAGYRSLWATVGVTVIVLVYMRKGWLGALVSGGLAWVVYQLLPIVGQLRFLLLIEALQGNFRDTSALERWDRIIGAFNSIRTYPLGLGWSGAGWPHSDFLQVAANLGVVAGVIFALWFLFTLFQLWRASAKRPEDMVLLSLLGSFIVAGGLLLAEGIEVLPQYALPVWFIWALAQARIQQTNTKPKLVRAADVSSSQTATLQSV